jgi:hypothetical protein
MLRADPFTDEADKGVAKAWRLGGGILARRFRETAALTAARRQRGVGWRGYRA